MRMHSERLLARLLPPLLAKRQLATFRSTCLTMTNFGSFVPEQDTLGLRVAHGLFVNLDLVRHQI